MFAGSFNMNVRGRVHGTNVAVLVRASKWD
jgi:hypothetical protein